MITRRRMLQLLLVAGAGLGAAPARAKPPSRTKPKTVLFICTGNYYRSRFAQAAFNEKTGEKWTAISRGLDVSTPRKTPVSPLVVAELDRRHVDRQRVAGQPTALTRADLDAADVIVLLDGAEHKPMLQRLFPDFPLDKIRAWSVADAPKLAPESAFAEIWKQTEALIAELGTR